MGTVSYKSITVYLLADREGAVHVRKRMPYLAQLGPGEYAFEVTVRIPAVRRPAVAGSLTIDLPPDVDPEAVATIDGAGPIEVPDDRE
jgi:hypothetical protein